MRKLLALAIMAAVVWFAYLKPKQEGDEERKNFIFRAINRWLAKGETYYAKIIRNFLAHSKRSFAAFGIALVGIWAMAQIVPQSFLPQEDQGYFTIELELPEGATLERTREVTNRAMAWLLEQPDVRYVLNVTGSSPRIGTNQSRSQMTVIMKPWEERENPDLPAFMETVMDEMSKYPESKVYLSTPPVIPGLGTSGGFEMSLEARPSWC